MFVSINFIFPMPKVRDCLCQVSFPQMLLWLHYFSSMHPCFKSNMELENHSYLVIEFYIQFMVKNHFQVKKKMDENWKNCMARLDARIFNLNGNVKSMDRQLTIFVHLMHMP
jgi:hypothetical protein